MNIKMKKEEKQHFPDFLVSCLKMAVQRKYQDYYILLDLTKKNRLIGAFKPNVGCVILAHAQISYDAENYKIITWMFWDLLELKSTEYHEEFKNIPGEIW